jgi:uncharacterized protein (UPF0248 family)
MTKKGELEEWMSRIKYSNENPDDYSIVFRDLNDFIEISFSKFITRLKEDSIPLHRISQIRKNKIPVFTRPSFCTHCGHPLRQKKCINPSCKRY